ncbi:MAG: hypothetical protein K0Q72_3560, partial [Armatimonadetes bacterium]|nr:hypothetical protein [Armatimonadota bacterium]
RLYQSLTPEQKSKAAFPFTDPRATKISANWHIVPEKIGEFYTPEQQQMIHEILRGVTSEEGYDRFIRQMRDDDGGLENFSCALFGEPGAGKFEWVMTGRHVTIRADGNHVPDAVFGGPIVYGHGAAGNQKENLFYYQTQVANQVFQALDGKQREKALLGDAPAESSIELKKDGFAGIAAGELSADQRGLMQKVMKELLAPYREADVKEAMDSLKANGGLEKVHLAFYKSEDLGSDKEWDIWRLEGPTLVWHFRGAPHVHTWVNWKTKTA